jgi:predicted DCC family thiol-disulfide oxidoreductase YuxK
MPPILLYDGVCGLCNRFVQFILRRDRNAVFRFASLQSALAADVLVRHGLKPGDLDTVYVVVNLDSHRPNPDSHHPNEGMNEFLLARSDAVLFVLNQLGGPWRAAASLAQLLPKVLRDLAYNAVARNRYRIFGRSESCILPSAEDRNRFLDL